jgi:RNA polymerase sigma-70 factor (ECF subfamily)
LQRVSDAELVRRAQSRQDGTRSGAQAVGEIYDRYHERIFRYLWARLSEKSLAEDLTAEVFMRMITHLDHFRSPRELPPETAFQSWMYRIAHNLLVDHYRKESRRQDSNLEQVEHLGEKQDSLAAAVEQSLLFDQVLEMLHKLSQEYQDVLILRFMVGMPVQEVAHVLGKSPAAVKIAQHRGLQKLQATLMIAGSEAHDG